MILFEESDLFILFLFYEIRCRDDLSSNINRMTGDRGSWSR